MQFPMRQTTIILTTIWVRKLKPYIAMGLNIPQLTIQTMMYFFMQAERILVGMNIGYYGNVKYQSSRGKIVYIRRGTER